MQAAPAAAKPKDLRLRTAQAALMRALRERAKKLDVDETVLINRVKAAVWRLKAG